ncbi:Hepatocellular carcinoma-associated antigen 59 [Carex littledalei]|uniref:Hepatocellular carcinoma-associated antigen 59 n=1 Tax=Carex littledalei TaxID=544730 RepID=A0A833QVY3_9POAL|nr:Hepatocellular carcinoma-associated antigen 59 [Carex littledalei]
MPPKKNFRKRTHDDDLNKPGDDSDDELQRRVLEEVRFLQKQRARKTGIPALPTVSTGTGALHAGMSGGRGGEGGGEEKEEQVLQDTFAQETAVTIEDPNMMRYVEQELAKRRGKEVDASEEEGKDQVDELYVVPDHLKVKKRNSEESSTQWTTGIAEVQLPIEYKLRNIEETEAAKKQLQEKRLASKTKSDLSIPASYSADYIHRGRDYAEKLRREHPESYKEHGPQSNEAVGKPTEAIKSDNNNDSGNGNNNKAEGGRREAATDEFMLERFRKREKYRVMRR